MACRRYVRVYFNARKNTKFLSTATKNAIDFSNRCQWLRQSTRTLEELNMRITELICTKDRKLINKLKDIKIYILRLSCTMLAERECVAMEKQPLKMIN